MSSGDTLTITGSKTDVDAYLTLNIDAGKKVIWQATYTATATYNNLMLYLHGDGTFEMADGAISNNNGLTVGNAIALLSNTSMTFIMSGGTVSGNSSAIVTGDTNATFNITGGTISSNGYTIWIDGTGGSISVSGNALITSSLYYAIMTYESNVTVSGNPIISSNGHGGIACKNITISGGTITSSYDWASVVTFTGVLKMTGGTVEATGNGVDPDSLPTAIYAYRGGTAAITGGTVRATGTNGVAIAAFEFSTVAYLTGTVTQGGFFVDFEGNWDYSIPNGVDGIIVEVDTLSVPVSRDGGSTGITTKAGGGTAKWNMSGANPVIDFTLSDNSNTYIPWGIKASDPAPPTNVPQTGESNMLWWTALLVGSLLFLAVLTVMYFRKRHLKSNETR